MFPVLSGRCSIPSPVEGAWMNGLRTVSVIGRMRRRLAVGGVLGALAVLASVPSARADGLTLTDPGFRDETVLPNLGQPESAAWAPDGRIFVTDKRGWVNEFDSAADTTPTVVWSDDPDVNNWWDRGLSGIALDPGFQTNRRMYLLYTRDKSPDGAFGPWNDDCPAAE